MEGQEIPQWTISLVCKISFKQIVQVFTVGKGVIPPFLGHPPPFSKIFPFLEIQDAPTFYKPMRKTNVVNDSFNQFVYKFHPKSILILEE